MSNPIFTLIHISDLHFGETFRNKEEWFHNVVAAVPGVRRLQGYFPHSYQKARALGIAIRRIIENRHAKSIPVVVVHTGDITASGRPAEFAVGRTFLQDIHTGGPDQQKPILFDIPGNHDLWQRKKPAGLNAFLRHYDRSYPVRHTIQFGSQTLHLYGLNSNVATLSEHRRAIGEVDMQDLLSVTRSIAHHRGPATFQIVAMHHPLLDPRDGASDLKLKNRDWVARHLRAAGADLVLAGHVHVHGHFSRNDTQPTHLVAGTGCQMSSPTAWSFNVVEVYEGHMVSRKHECGLGTFHFLPGDGQHVGERVQGSLP